MGPSLTPVKQLELLPGGELLCATEREGLIPRFLLDGLLSLALVHQEPIGSR